MVTDEMVEAALEAAKGLGPGWMRAALEAAERASLRCTVCRAPAVAAPVFTGVAVPRCADHMEMENEGRLR